MLENVEKVLERGEKIEVRGNICVFVILRC